jgi:hypothetical protein
VGESNWPLTSQSPINATLWNLPRNQLSGEPGWGRWQGSEMQMDVEEDILRGAGNLRPSSPLGRHSLPSLLYHRELFPSDSFALWSLGLIPWRAVVRKKPRYFFPILSASGCVSAHGYVFRLLLQGLLCLQLVWTPESFVSQALVVTGKFPCPTFPGPCLIQGTHTRVHQPSPEGMRKMNVNVSYLFQLGNKLYLSLLWTCSFLSLGLLQSLNHQGSHLPLGLAYPSHPRRSGTVT